MHPELLLVVFDEDTGFSQTFFASYEDGDKGTIVYTMGTLKVPHRAFAGNETARNIFEALAKEFLRDMRSRHLEYLYWPLELYINQETLTILY
jgi:hypothetical protein